MAATPPTPPGANNFQLNGNSPQQQQRTANNPSHNNTPSISEALHQHFQFKALLNADEDQQQQLPPKRISSSSNNNNNNNISRSSSYEQLEEAARPKAKLSCQCTNISIMHLFHEMKQEFPTLPDALVTQCVNENCHQRDNCIQMLKKELSLHPIPVQSYPAKVLQQQQQQQQQQQLQQHQLQQRQTKPPTPLKPSRAAPTQPPIGHANGNGNGNDSDSVEAPPIVPPARPRPTTLNLQRQLNAQLQQKIQQRQQQQQQQQQPPQLTPGAQYKPLRRAPPLPPKRQTAIASSGDGAALSLAQQQQQQQLSSFSNDSSCLTSPLSSSESELSLSVSLSSPTTSAAITATAAAPAPTATAATPAPTTTTTAQLRSPVRHRSVITLQPEPPYAREFSNNAVAISPTPPSPTSGASTPSGRKSFTSLNLTLRQPQQSNGGAAPATIDITAGPAASGNGSSGITYSSSSFDARRGTHKNFQLIVTDEGSVFSAGCVRPQVPLYAPCPPPPVLATDGATPPPSAFVSSQSQQQQPQPQPTAAVEEMAQVFPYPTQAQNHIVASNYNNNHLHNSSADNSPSVTHMPLYEGVVPECDREAHAATIERQKTRRDKLANVLRDNKKRLLSLEQEINILTEPIPVGESERLDRDIRKLTDDCQRLLNMINDPQLNGTAAASNPMNRQLSAPASNNSQTPQPHPRQRGVPGRVPPNSLRLHSVPAPPTQSQLDYVQQHSSAPSSACLTPQQQYQQQQMHLQMQEPPPTYAQYYQFQQFLQHQRAEAAARAAAAAPHSIPPPRPHTNDEEEESLSGSDEDEGEEPLDTWACNLCTFRNHPQLNVCEACENVRIQPGMIRILPSGNDNANSSPTSAAAAGTDGNRQQPYALHT
ncbi:ataxin-2 homolog isoform X1 [Drosophila sulfurigaster albostrigata]|uniref:ataxin-2 homolog isoform X1 n=1 Tax=Drosophila sulfurigaster albostrigata TaxID=89887 RepID=UPI002D21E6E8|nr:ataxin-2 homolog isoform X1 [Drosophila sulfurigaster albostrigata]XP_062132064.1 ataxin-2 homolog isoform X1 [Drosophila sulfurigaster albostrigata]